MTWKVRVASALVLGGLTLALLATGAVAGGKIDKFAEEQAKEKATQVQMLAEAYKMAEFGKEYHSPLTLITAGGILWKLQELQDKLQEQTVKEFKVEFDPDAPKEEVKTPVKIRTIKQQANELFEQARIDGAGLPEIEKLIKLAKDPKYVQKPDPGTRGSAIGPQVINRVIPARATHSFKIPFVAGLPAQFAFRSTGPCQVSLVNARNENLIGAGVVMVGNANWVPGGAKARGGNIMFTVRVRNMAGGPVQYQILTN